MENMSFSLKLLKLALKIQTMRPEKLFQHNNYIWYLCAISDLICNIFFKKLT